HGEFGLAPLQRVAVPQSALRARSAFRAVLPPFGRRRLLSAWPGGEWADRACEPDDPRAPRGRRAREPGAGPARICPDHPPLQRAAAAQRFGLPASGGLLPRRPDDQARSASAEAGASASLPPRAKPATAAGDLTLCRGENCCYDLRRVCAIVDETNH